jgi:acyl-coenzyme A thioesterase PaaI-like protein
MTDSEQAVRAGFMTPSGDFVVCVACRLGITCEKLLEESKGHTLVTRPTNQAGSSGVAHGGWTASVLDGMLGHLALFTVTFTVTSSLSVEYL